ncbi:ubiquitin specific protease 20/33 [Leptinotarsa decemlineata]|uniref:ubiquitin specific protease 20/33 n=1 Tax=Leptinotarsa decemlineata TaxID=7539 RepID=UPI003D306D59
MAGCSHLALAENIPISTLLASKELICSDCNCRGPNLWICLYKNCLRIGCGEKSSDHSTTHNVKYPMHCVHMNLSTRRIWCHECKREVFMESAPYNDSDQETESCTARSRDSGHGSYSTLRTNTPERGHSFEPTVGLNVGMSGDASDSSDGEDYHSYHQEKPCGLVGLQNIGNTCYMNAALQALSNTEPLTKFFLECAYTVHMLSEGKKPGLSRTYQALMRDIWVKKVNQGYVTPSGILQGIRNVHVMFRGFQQHDTQEFLRNFMDQLHEELKQVAPPEPCSAIDADTFSLAMEEPTAFNSNYDSSEGEYETCDSGVSERSSLSDDTERPASGAKRRLSRCGSPNRKQRPRVQSSCVIDSQPTTTSSSQQHPAKKQVKHRSIISDIFDGKLLSSVQCLTCNRVSSRVETFQDLSLPIPSKDHLVLLHGRSSGGQEAACSDALIQTQDGWISWILAWFKSWFYGPTVTLHDCLAAFFSTDELKGDNMYSCEKCNKLRNGVKFSKVLQLPEVLCIHLKRFRHELMFSSKISSAVSFPLKGLDMRPYLHTDCVSKVSSYQLFSVICHHGTAGGGHYTCFALNSGQWYEFDDQYVTKVSGDKVQMCEAYVLFYQKVGVDAVRTRDKAEKILEETAENMLDNNIRRTYISRQWINRFYYCSEPGPIDNSDFLCQHGSVSPDRDVDMDKIAMVVPYEVYDYLFKKYGGCPPFAGLSVCPACSALQKRLLLEMETFVQVSREAQNRDAPHTHFLSTSWYTQWHNFVQKRNQEPPGPIDNSKINLNQLDLNEAADVPECIWNFFYNIYGGGPEIRIKPTLEEEESEEDIPEPEEAYAFEPPRKHRTDSMSSCTSEQARQEPQYARNLTDKSHGEPVEVHAKHSDVAKEVQMEIVLTKSETSQADEDATVTMPNNSEDGSVDDETSKEAEKEVRSSKRHRRRRKN